MKAAVGLVAAAVVAVLLSFGSGAAVAAGPGDIVVTVPEGTGSTSIADAQLRWGLNAESGAGAYAGGCNFLSAGLAGDAGGSRVWTAGDGLYRPADGAVRVEKPAADGGWEPASWETKCLDANGAPLAVASTSSQSGNQVVIDGGRGTVVPGGGVEIRWTGSFSVVFYGGMTYWSVTDPVLTLDPQGNGRLIADASGYGASMDDATTWTRIAPTSVVLAEIRGADVSAGAGFAVTPQYLGVSVSNAGQVGRDDRNSAYWGAFPQSFVDFHGLTGQQGYWVTTNGARDAAKPASTLYVSYDASAPVPVTPPAGAGGGASGASPSNPLRAAAVAATAAAAEVPLFPFAATTAMTTTPERAGLVPDAGTGLSPLVMPLLASALALVIAILAVLSLMQALPWQRPAASP